MSRCSNEINQIQSDVSETVDLILGAAAKAILSDQEDELQALDDKLITLGRLVKRFAKSHTMSCRPNEKASDLLGSISSVRDLVITGKPIRLNDLLDKGKAFAQDQSLSQECCN